MHLKTFKFKNSTEATVGSIKNSNKEKNKVCE